MKFLSFLIMSACFISSAFANAVLNVKTITLDKGVKVYYVPAPEIPMVDVLVAFKAGSDRDQSHFGLANLTAHLLGQATKALNTNQIADKMDGLGMAFNVQVSKDMSVVHFRSLTASQYLQPSLDLFVQLLTKAAFPEKNFNRTKNNALQAILQSKQSAAKVASKTFARLIFENTPYAHSAVGTLSSMKNITLSQVKDFYKTYYNDQNAMVVIVGAVDDFQAKAIGQDIVNALPKGKKPTPLTFKVHAKPQVQKIAFPADQTSIRMGEPAVSYHKAIDPALIVGNYILGNGMTSRLFQIVRNQYGLTYGIGSYFLPLNQSGAFMIALQTKNANVKKAIKITQDVVQQYLKAGPTKAELNAAKNYLIGSFPLKIASNADKANYVLKAAFNHIPFSYLDTYRQNIKKVTAAQAKSVLNQYVNPKAFVVVTVGGGTQKLKAADKREKK